MSERLRRSMGGHQAGMTLVELLLAMSIMVIIMGTVGTVVAFVARSTVPTSYSATHADNIMISAAYWAQDVAAAQNFVNAPSGLTSTDLTKVAQSGCTSITGTAFAWFYFQPLGLSSSPYTTSVVYSYNGSTITRTDCETSPNHVVELTTAYDASGGAPAVACRVGGVDQSCTSRGNSTAVSLTLPLKTVSAQGVTVSTTPVLTGAWMLANG